jgi:hypothetical protein
VPVTDRGDDHQTNYLHHRNSEIAKSTGQAQRRAFESVREKALALLAEAAKLPPPIPLNAAQTRYGHNGSPG